MSQPGKRQNETDEEFAARRRRVRTVHKRVLLGYGVAGSLFALAVVLFVVAIVIESGQAGGVGGVVIGSSIVVAVVTGTYHSEYYPIKLED